ncbi:ParA family protein [Acidipila sp. EB88]|uniref:ParA family protein n=1 Tax=Acidipila sp. EB88 TaxID=2305226 RepID=UPI000F5FB228|nr:ParA family protein [Acidipila sp. EB88]RRA50352.1 ParA family protein [Acidipila sp. EB88]RRA50360.1 ParA family protein [Acidipila sp. EB88]
MILTVLSNKGGSGKSTSAVHLAAYFQMLAPTLLLDGDQTRNALAWSQRGPGLPFKVAPIDQAAMLARSHTHVVIDTGQRLGAEDLKAAADGCDWLVIPAVPSALDVDSTGQTVRALQELGHTRFCVLLTKVAADSTHEVNELRALLSSMKVRTVKASIPRFKAFERAAGAGQLVQDMADRNGVRGWAAYQEAGKEIQKWARQK